MATDLLTSFFRIDASQVRQTWIEFEQEIDAAGDRIPSVLLLDPQNYPESSVIFRGNPGTILIDWLRFWSNPVAVLSSPAGGPLFKLAWYLSGLLFRHSPMLHHFLERRVIWEAYRLLTIKNIPVAEPTVGDLDAEEFRLLRDRLAVIPREFVAAFMTSFGQTYPLVLTPAPIKSRLKKHRPVLRDYRYSFISPEQRERKINPLNPQLHVEKRTIFGPEHYGPRWLEWMHALEHETFSLRFHGVAHYHQGTDHFVIIDPESYADYRRQFTTFYNPLFAEARRTGAPPSRLIQAALFSNWDGNREFETFSSPVSFALEWALSTTPEMDPRELIVVPIKFLQAKRNQFRLAEDARRSMVAPSRKRKRFQKKSPKRYFFELPATTTSPTPVVVEAVSTGPARYYRPFWEMKTDPYSGSVESGNRELKTGVVVLDDVFYYRLPLLVADPSPTNPLPHEPTIVDFWKGLDKSLARDFKLHCKRDSQLHPLAPERALRKHLIGVHYTLQEDQAIMRLLRPGMAKDDKLKLQALCPGRTWLGIRLRAATLCLQMIEDGERDIGRLPRLCNTATLHAAIRDGRYALAARRRRGR